MRNSFSVLDRFDLKLYLSHAPVLDFSLTLPDGDRLRETISAYTGLSSIGRWLFESKLGKSVEKGRISYYAARIER